MKILLQVAILALLLVLLTGFIPNKSWQVYPHIFGCEEGCYMVSAGYPISYIVDNPNSSPANSASLYGALIWDDNFFIGKFLLSYLFWVLLTSLGYFLFMLKYK